MLIFARLNRRTRTPNANDQVWDPQAARHRSLPPAPHQKKSSVGLMLTTRESPAKRLPGYPTTFALGDRELGSSIKHQPWRAKGAAPSLISQGIHTFLSLTWLKRPPTPLGFAIHTLVKRQSQNSKCSN